MFSWIYDAVPDDSGVQFRFIKYFCIHRLPYSNIDSISEVSGLNPVSMTAFNFKSRFFSRCFLIVTKSGWFTRRILLTPASPENFLSLAAKGGVEKLPLDYKK